MNKALLPNRRIRMGIRLVKLKAEKKDTVEEYVNVFLQGA